MSVSYCLVAVELWELKFLSRPPIFPGQWGVRGAFMCSAGQQKYGDIRWEWKSKAWKRNRADSKRVETAWERTPNDRECKRERGVSEKSTEMRHDTVRKRESECSVFLNSWLCPKYLSVNVGADVPERSPLNQSTWLLTLSEGQIPFTLTSSHPA